MLALLPGLILSAPAHAATLMGSGITVSCGGWVEARRNNVPIKPVLEEWGLGYLSGIAIWTPHYPLDNLDPPAVFVWLDNYCQQNPLEPFKSALDAFVRARATPPPQPAPTAPQAGQRPPAQPNPAAPPPQAAPRPR